MKVSPKYYPPILNSARKIITALFTCVLSLSHCKLLQRTIFLVVQFVGVSVSSGNAQTNIFPATGNVGIGTSNPDGKLHINAPLDGSTSTLRIGGASPGNIYVPTGASTGGYNIDFHTWRDLVPDQIGARIRAERINNYFGNNALIQSMDLSFYTSDGMDQSRLSEKVRIKSNGDVGVGTFDPQHKLHVEGSIGGTLITIRSPNTWQTGLNVYNNLGNGFQFNVGGSTNQAIGAGHLGIYGSESNKYLLAILSSGNVGIGTTTPMEKLTVNGTIRSQEIKVDNQN